MKNNTINIIKASREFTARDRFLLTRNPAGISMSNAVGTRVNVMDWCIFDDTNERGETRRLLSLLGDDGRVYTTISTTVHDSFQEILDVLEEDNIAEVGTIEIVEGVSKKDRKFLNVTLV